MIGIVELALPIVALISLLLALGFAGRAWRSREAINRQPYGVGRQEVRRGMQLSLLYGGVALVIGALALLGRGILSFPAAGPAPAATIGVTTDVVPAGSTAVSGTAPPAPAGSLTPLVTPSPSASPTNPVPTPTDTATPTLTPTPTATPLPRVVVNSPNGLYLRPEPGGTEEVELIRDGAVLIFLGERRTANDLEWIRVRTPAGNEGWVAVAFVTFPDE